jgi:hypothetical protein
MINYREILHQRLQPLTPKLLNVESVLADFALINYALPKARLAPYIPADRFEIPEFSINGEQLCLMSAVPFLDVDFHFSQILPWKKFTFAQTNYRVYVIDKHTRQHVVWFFGTTLGSYYVYLPRLMWRIPWYYAKYQLECKYDSKLNKYDTYRISISSDWAAASIDITDTGEDVTTHEGFDSYDALKLILTHPLTGYYFRLDKRLGSYAVWHEEIPITKALPNSLYFSLYERLGLLTKEEMNNPISIFLCPNTTFQVILPPQPVSA